MFGRIFGWTRGVEVGIIALSLGERVARVRRFHQSVSRRSRVRGYFLRRAKLLCRAKPSPAVRDPLPHACKLRRNQTEAEERYPLYCPAKSLR
jgi:hypothetical protein